MKEIKKLSGWKKLVCAVLGSALAVDSVWAACYGYDTVQCAFTGVTDCTVTVTCPDGSVWHWARIGQTTTNTGFLVPSCNQYVCGG